MNEEPPVTPLKPLAPAYGFFWFGYAAAFLPLATLAEIMEPGSAMGSDSHVRLINAGAILLGGLFIGAFPTGVLILAFKLLRLDRRIAAVPQSKYLWWMCGFVSLVLFFDTLKFIDYAINRGWLGPNIELLGWVSFLLWPVFFLLVCFVWKTRGPETPSMLTR